MPVNVAGKQMSNGALAVAAGLIVGLVATFLPWHSTTVPTVFAAVAVAVGGYLMKSDPQPATRPLSSYQPTSTSNPPAMPPPAPPPPAT